MTHEEIAEKIKAFIETEFPNPGMALAIDTNLLEDWFVDSLGIVQAVMFVEESFGVHVSRADINGTNFHSVETLTEFVASRLAATG
jgi:methoxymalonate biosynthesis acyl carrier protein